MERESRTVNNAKSEKEKGGIGLYRWIIILIIIGNVFLASLYAPVMPHVQVPPEPVIGPFNLPILGEFAITNTLIAIFIVDVILLIFAISIRRATRQEQMVLGGLAGAVEAILEALYSLTETTAKKWADRVFPWVATIVLIVLVANWTELIPGVDSIGILHAPHHDAPTYETEDLCSIGGFNVGAITDEIEIEVGEGTHESEQVEGVGFTPFVRVNSTDLNFTLALALISVTVSQIFGLRAVGIDYFKKFFNFGRLGKMLFRKELGPFDLIFPFTDIFVGLLELIAEIAKIVSFTFRLFGNIFAGSVLLFVIGSLIPVVVQSGFLFLELFVGLVQALVFGMLTLVFITMATIAHDQGQEHS
jgi:F-type H+-transporting ATPase subunit a